MFSHATQTTASSSSSSRRRRRRRRRRSSSSSSSSSRSSKAAFETNAAQCLLWLQCSSRISVRAWECLCPSAASTAAERGQGCFARVRTETLKVSGYSCARQLAACMLLTTPVQLLSCGPQRAGTRSIAAASSLPSLHTVRMYSECCELLLQSAADPSAQRRRVAARGCESQPPPPLPHPFFPAAAMV